MDDVLAMESGQGGKTVANDGNGDARLDAGLDGSVSDNDPVDIRPAAVADARLEPLEHAVAEQVAEIVAVDPFHLHHSDATAVDPVVDVEEVVLLDFGDARGDRGHAAHGLIVGAFVFVAFGGEDLDGNGKGEIVRPAAFTQVDYALAARTERANQVMMLGPTEPLLLDDRTIA